MRNLFTLLLIAGFFSADAAPKIKLKVKHGYWSSINWDLNRLPKDGDTIVIPKDSTLIINQDVELENVYFDVLGNLILVGNTKLELDERSKIFVRAGGMLDGDNNSQQVRLDNDKIYQGDKGTIFGPMLATATSSGFKPLIGSPVSLPVKFIGFNVIRNSNDVFIQWATAQEINADIYEVQRSVDGSNWNVIGTVRAAGNTTTVTNYSFTDKNANYATAYYRIKQVDVDNRYDYTAVRTVKADATAAISAVGARGNIVLQFPEKVKGQVEVRLISLGGQVISRQVINQPLGQVVIPASIKGNYIVTVADQQEIQLSKQILL